MKLQESQSTFRTIKSLTKLDAEIWEETSWLNIGAEVEIIRDSLTYKSVLRDIIQFSPVKSTFSALSIMLFNC